jgi:predicted MFS family arabinose efflux permease
VAEKAPPGRRAEAIAFYGSGGFVAQALSPYLCEWLLSVLPFDPVNRFRAIFALSALLTGLALALSFSLSPDQPHHEQHLAPDPWYRVLQSPTMIYLVLPSIVFGAGYSSIFNFITDFTQVKNLGSPSHFFISYSVTVIALRLSTGRFLDRLDRRWIVVAALGIITVGLYYASLCAGSEGLALVGILTGTGHGYIFPSLSTLTYDSSPARNRGTSMSLYMLGFDLSNMIASPILGHVAQTRDYFTMYRISSLVVLAGMLLYATGWRYHAPSALRRAAGRAKRRDEFIKDNGALR